MRTGGWHGRHGYRVFWLWKSRCFRSVAHLARQQRFMCLVMEMLGKSLEDTSDANVCSLWRERERRSRRSLLIKKVPGPAARPWRARKPSTLQPSAGAPSSLEAVEKPQRIREEGACCWKDGKKQQQKAEQSAPPEDRGPRGGPSAAAHRVPALQGSAAGRP